MADRGRGRGRGRGQRGGSPAGDRGGSPPTRGSADRGRGTPQPQPARGRGGGGGGERGGPRGGRGGPRGSPGPTRGGAPPTPGGPVNQPTTAALTIASHVQAQGVKRPGFGTSGTPILLYTNCFEAKIPEEPIYHYDVEFSPGIQNKARKMELFKQMLELPAFKEVSTQRGVYDSDKQYFSTAPLGRDLQIPLTNGRRTTTIRLKQVAALNPQVLHEYIQGQMSLEESVTTVLAACNVAIRMGLIDTYPIYNRRSFFVREAECQPFWDRKYAGQEMWRGFFQSIRPAMGRMIVNVDTSTGVVFKEAPLIQLCLQYIGERNVNNVQRLANLSPPAREGLARFLRGVKIQPERGSPARHTIKGITARGANMESFRKDDGSMITIANHYQSKNKRLKYPQLFCVEEIKTGTKSPAKFPVEVCVVPTQLLPKQVERDQVNDVLKFSTRRPEERLQSIRNGFQYLQYDRSPYLQDFGIKIDPNPLQFYGRVLPPPELVYGKDREGKNNLSLTPSKGAWKTKRFFSPEVIQGWILMSYEPRDGVFSNAEANRVMQGLSLACQAVGIRVRKPQPLIMPPNDPMRNDFVADIKEARAQYRRTHNSDANLIIIILPENPGDIYAGIKHAGDVVEGIATQCLQVGKVGKKDGHPVNPNQDYFLNVSLKINVKLGGINVVAKDTEVPFITKARTLILGADVMHSKVMGDEGLGKPSFAAVTGNVDLDGCKYVGCSRAQRTRVEMIQDMEGMVSDIIAECRKHPSRLKIQRVLYYRDGVAENQFKDVIDQEIPQIRNACRKAGLGNINVTCVVVGKRHHIRGFPVLPNELVDKKNGNLPPGTVIDTVITHPVEFDFYMIPHAGIKGTSRPVHFNVLVDENLFTPDDLQKLSFALCHVYARSTRSVSLPAPVYYAHLVCERAGHRYDPRGDFRLDASLSRNSQTSEAEAMLKRYIEAFQELHVNTRRVMYFQ